ncbi:MAG TPA: biotin transporter BioY [Pyrinomonadaceae bacterium]|jgi:biotin transport system substrate-specific component
MESVNTFAKTETLTGAMLAPLDGMRSIALVVAFSLLTALAAQIAIPLPFTPVPLTGQVFAVLLTGALLGSRLGALAMFAYLVEGASGLPFFYGGRGGVEHLLLSPTSGYLWAYPLAAFVTGALAERGWDRRYLSAATAMTLGSVIILFGGFVGLLRFMSPAQAFSAGVVPFIIGDVIKIALAAAVLPSGWALLRRMGSL